MTKASSLRASIVHPLALFKPTTTSTVLSEQFKTQLTDEEKKTASLISNVIQSQLGEEHPFDYEIIEGVVKKFGLVNAVIDKITDFSVGGGIYIECDDDNVIQILDDWRRETHFDTFIRPWFKEGLAKGSGYMEIAGLANSGKQNMVKVVNSNTVFVKRDKFGNIQNFNQYLGASIGRINPGDIISLNKDEIIQININKVGSSAYGQGIVYSALTTINDFLMAQASMHKLVKRKANSPVHWKLGNADKDDYPSQEDIDAYGNKLQFMNESTEYVTGPNAEAIVINYGDIGDKFVSVLENDYKLLSYSFQVPEIILGSKEGGSGMGGVGISTVQLDAFERRCRSYQEEINYILMTKVFDKVLEDNGVTGANYSIKWGYLSDDEKNKRITALKDLISVVSEGMKIEIEKKIAVELGIDYDVIEQNNADVQQQQHDNMKKQAALGVKPKFESITESIDIYSRPVHETTVTEGVTVNNWLNKDISKHTESIIDEIMIDEFNHLKGITKSNKDKLRVVFKEAVEQNLVLKDIIKNISETVKVPAIKKDGEIVVTSEQRINLIATTELTRLLNKGLKKSYEKSGDILVRWDATIDERTCPVCHELNNRIFDLYELAYLPPIHPNCRCSIDEVAQKKESITGIVLDNELAPQELELQLQKATGLSEEKVKKFLSTYKKLNDSK